MPKPAKAKYNVRSRNVDIDGSVISSGVFDISQENKPNAAEKQTAAPIEDADGPYLSTSLPTGIAKGYCPAIPLMVLA